MMPWLAVTLDLEAGAAEAFGDALLAAGAQSVALEAGACPPSSGRTTTPMR